LLHRYFLKLEKERKKGLIDMNNHLYNIITQIIVIICITILSCLKIISQDMIYYFFGLITSYLFRNKTEIVDQVRKKE
jgi:hypothetical protein